MRKIYLLFSVLLLLSISNVLQAQNRTVSGTVLDEKSVPLPGVTVQVKGSSAATVTDVNGKYAIKVTNLQNVVIGVSFVGYAYQSKTLKVGEKNADFNLVPNNNNLDEVVVVGYGEQKKSTLTGSIATISTKDIQDIPNLNFLQTLSGQTVNLSISGVNRPGQATSSVTIRNPVSLNSNGGTTSPLFIIDDQFRTQADFDLLDVSEIESISVLKDAEAAVYGISGGQGAIIVRTKKGKAGAPKITFSTQFGTANAVQLPKYLSGIQMAQWSNAYTQMSVQAPQGVQTGNSIDANGYVNGNVLNKNTSWYTPDELAYIANPANNTNWLKQYFHAADVEHESLTISGGSDKATYFIAGTYTNQNSNFSGLENHKWGVRANVETKPAKGLTVGLNLDFNYSFDKEFWMKYSGEQLNNDVTILGEHLPWLPYFINGNPVNVASYQTGGAGIDNINFPLFQNSNNFEQHPDYVTNLLSHIDYEIPGIPGLSAGMSFNDNINAAFPTQYGTQFTYYLYSGQGDNSHIPGGTIKSTTTLQNGYDITFNPDLVTSYQIDAKLNYQHSFGKNHITALALYEQKGSTGDGVNTSVTAPIIGALPNYNFATGTQTANQNNSLVYETATQSYVERINYDYDGTYLVQASSRQDGTTVFAPGRRWGNFGEVSLGYVISNEKFFKEAAPWVDQLKLRASVGLLGGNGVNSTAYQYFQQYGVKTGSSGGAVFNEGERGNGIAPAALPNPYATWDHKFETDYGVDLQLLKNRLAITGDYYWTHGYDLLAATSAAVPLTVGNTAPAENFGIVNNFGTELTVTWRDHISQDWSYNITAFYGWMDDKNIREPIQAGVAGTAQDRTGKSDDGGVFGYESLGIIRTQAQANQIIAERAKAAGGAQYVKIFGLTPAPGMINFADLNGDGIVENTDTKDEKYLSNKSSNHNNGGFNFGFSYKSLSINVVTGLSWGGTTAIPGNELTSDTKGDLDENRLAIWNEGYWTPQTPNAKLPAPYYYSEWNVPTNFWFVNSFNWNISQANLAYSLPVTWIKHVGLANARLFVQCTNVLSLYNPYPESYRAQASAAEGYPELRTITLGLNAGF
ncbi:SusC/RagA family TonB-linked outer membrane protein [Mucilaginibacter sp. L196]|uniref:SusC/RagA family TonB-linked outer membrane protein n=1 Tax=Mucilaginibacter sp. L196 TaxID=1641870 RepID=UPI00131E700F|nr:SusC/RagA family TonB-linked outer membrane protein [Mucilaginibacter sp. L196]